MPYHLAGVEVVAAGPGYGGRFDLVVKPGPAPWKPHDDCITDLGSLDDRKLTGQQWETGCKSSARSGSPAQWYTSTLGSRTTVDIGVKTVDGSLKREGGWYSL